MTPRFLWIILVEEFSAVINWSYFKNKFFLDSLPVPCSEKGPLLQLEWIIICFGFRRLLSSKKVEFSNTYTRLKSEKILRIILVLDLIKKNFLVLRSQFIYFVYTASIVLDE